MGKKKKDEKKKSSKKKSTKKDEKKSKKSKEKKKADKKGKKKGEKKSKKKVSTKNSTEAKVEEKKPVKTSAANDSKTLVDKVSSATKKTTTNTTTVSKPAPVRRTGNKKSVDYAAREAIVELRKLTTSLQITNFTKGDTRVTVSRAANTAKANLKK